jgi:hypothetical protein
VSKADIWVRPLQKEHLSKGLTGIFLEILRNSNEVIMTRTTATVGGVVMSWLGEGQQINCAGSFEAL